MQLAIILAVVATLAVAEYAQPVPTTLANLKLTGIFVAMTAVVGAASLISGLAAKSAESRPESLLAARQWLRVGLNLHLGLWLTASLLVLTVLDWPELMRGNWLIGQSFLCDEVLLLAPILVPLILSWAAFYEIDRRLSLSPRTRKAFVGLHVRHLLLPTLIPVLLVIATQDCTRYFYPGLVQSQWMWLTSVFPLGLIVFSYPWLLRLSWDAKPLSEGTLRTRLDAMLQNPRVKLNQILVWNSGHRVANAAVTGLSPCVRYIFLSDGLLRQLSEDEIEAVFAHEMGHIRHRHSLRLLAVLCLPYLSVVLCALGPSGGRLLHEVFGVIRLWPNAMVALAITGILYLGIIFRPYARLLELQADAWAVQRLDNGGSIDSLRQTTTHYLSALDRMTGPGEHRPLALHPTLANRRQFLHRILQDPRHAACMDRTIMRWDAALATCAFLPSLLRLFI